MAGTDRTQKAILGGPTVILVNPQLGENIGASARAMLNFGLTDLRLVNPRDGWPNRKARSAASHADLVIDAARVFETTREALAEMQVIYAATARPRDMLKDELAPHEAALEMRAAFSRGQKVGIMFGPERQGLANDDIVLARKIISVPTNPAYASLNLAQAVLLVAYEWFQSGDVIDAGRVRRTLPDEPPLAKHQDVIAMFEHLEAELDSAKFLKPVEKRQRMIRNIRNIFQRASLYEQEVRTLRGVIKALSESREPIV